jgi:hypothetical protein
MTMRKVYPIIVIAVLSSVLLGASSSAEAAPKNPGQKPNASQKHRDQLTVAQKELAQAHRLMSRALPIYKGHRVLSMDWTKVARGYIGIARQPGNNLPQSRGPQLDASSEKQSRFTAEQIARSQDLMRRALKALQAAATSLEKATAPNAQALNVARSATLSAISECQTAIALYPSAPNTPSAP